MGVEEFSLSLELVAFTRFTIILFHTFGMLRVELVGKAKVSVKHHLLEGCIAGKLVDALPLVLVRITAYVSLWAPTSLQHRFVVTIVEFSLVGRR